METDIITRVNLKHRSRILSSIRALLLASHPRVGRSSWLHSLFSSPLYDVYVMHHIMSLLYISAVTNTVAETQTLGMRMQRIQIEELKI